MPSEVCVLLQFLEEMGIYIPRGRWRQQTKPVFSIWFITSSKQQRDVGKLGKLAVVKRNILANSLQSRDSPHQGSSSVLLVCREAASRSVMSHWHAQLQLDRGGTRFSLGFYPFLLLGQRLAVRGHSCLPRLLGALCSVCHSDSGRWGTHILQVRRNSTSILSLLRSW